LESYARRHGTTVVVVEQKIALMSQFADELVIMEDGLVRYAAPPAEVLAHSDDLRRIGVNCPRVTTLTNHLRHDGLYAGQACRSVSEARDAVLEVLA
ncbi:MAG: ABC transporter ATP-binding protein, partial [Coriobacteriales bacterium]